MKAENRKKPFLGIIEDFKGKTYAMKEDWHVELYDISYYFLGFRLAKHTEERVIRHTEKIENPGD
ncbi:MAG: hypothetical protein IMY71_09710 [Bacteroidetes bacterium]|nr:hypothetical protein [Bacteroidota bacterium]